jgi:hypothetical protein
MSPHRSVPELRERKFMDHHCVQGICNFAVPKAPVFRRVVFVNYDKFTHYCSILNTKRKHLQS